LTNLVNITKYDLATFSVTSNNTLGKYDTLYYTEKINSNILTNLGMEISRYNASNMNFTLDTIKTYPMSLLYPRINMTNFITLDSNTGITYRACSYNNYDAFIAWQAFDNSSSRYVSTNCFSGTGSLNITGVSFGNDTNYKGTYLAIDMGQEIFIKKYSIQPGYDYYNPPRNNRLPKNWKIYATNNNNCWNNNGVNNGSLNTGSAYGWVEIDAQTNQIGYTVNRSFIINSSNYYRYYAIHVNAIGSGDLWGGYWDINNWFLYDNISEEGVYLNLLKTSLIANYNFDSNANDLTGNNYNLTNYNMSYDISDKIIGKSSALFNGNSYFEIANNGNFSSDNLSIAFWCKIQPSSSIQTIAFL